MLQRINQASSVKSQLEVAGIPVAGVAIFNGNITVSVTRELTEAEIVTLTSILGIQFNITLRVVS